MIFLLALLLAAVGLLGYLMVRDLKAEGDKAARLHELRRERGGEEVVSGRVADYQLLGWLPEEPRTPR